MLEATYHVHLKYCNHAEGVAEDYIKKAIELGFKEIGFSDHAPVEEYFLGPELYYKYKCNRNMKLKDVDIYLNDVRTARIKYKDKLSVLLGFETEFFPAYLEHYKMLRGLVEYLNLGVHFFPLEDGTFVNTFFECNYTNIERYADICIMAMETGLFNNLVHPDLFMYSYKDINGERLFDSTCEHVTRRIIEAAIKNNIYLEINANGIFVSNGKGINNYEDWLYPHYNFWRIASEYPKLKILIGADAHLINNLGGSHIADAIGLARRYNLKIQKRMGVNH